MSEETSQTVDREIRKLVVEAEEIALRILGENEDKLHSLARALRVYEVLDDAEIRPSLGRRVSRPRTGARLERRG